MPKSRNDRKRADGTTNKTKGFRPEVGLTAAGEMIASFFGRMFRSKVKAPARPKFSHLAAGDANINRWTGQPHKHNREIDRNMNRRLRRNGVTVNG